MNPFDLPGPQFLLFYLLLGVIVTMIVGHLRARREAGIHPLPRPDDPYLVAYLQRGAHEALRVASMSLIDRGLLRVEDKKLAAANPEARALVRRPIEKSILEAFREPREPAPAFEELEAGGACVDYAGNLTEAGLLPDEDARATRRRLYFAAMSVLLAFAITRILIAISRGRARRREAAA